MAIGIWHLLHWPAWLANNMNIGKIAHLFSFRQLLFTIVPEACLDPRCITAIPVGLQAFNPRDILNGLLGVIALPI